MGVKLRKLALPETTHSQTEMAPDSSTSETDRLFMLSIDMLCIAGFDGYFKKLNPAWGRTLGFTEEELTARPYLDFIHPDDRPATLAEAAKLASGIDTIHFENRYRCKDGSYKWLAWTAKQSVSEQLIFAIARDMSADQEAKEKIATLNASLAQKVAELEAANQELGAFSYSISHDLRAPLRSISGFIRIVLDEYGDRLDPEARKYLDRVLANAQHMGRQVDDLLAFSRLSRQPLQTRLVDTRDLVRRVLSQLQGAMDGRRIDLIVGDLPPCQGDDGLLEHVFTNLIGNAIKYTRRQPVARIEIGFVRDRAEPAYFVRDNGVGFDMRYAGKLFGVFQRLHAAEDFEGTGAGLAIAQRIVQRHHGRIWAEAEVGRGATFFFTLGPERETLPSAA